MRLLRSIERRLVPTALRRWLHRGSARYCPVCESWTSKFHQFGCPPRKDAQCPVCFALERHRLIWLYLSRKTDLFDGRHKRMLHVAPEPQLSLLFRQVANLDYLSVDLEPGKAMLCADITSLPFPDGSIDIIYCSHVLEHVPDDRKAMAEFCRLLNPVRGWSILQVPIKGETTFEDPSVTSPKDRERLFGQWDHVRIYGADYTTRLEAAGFDVTIDRFAHELSDEETSPLAIHREEDIYFCTRRGKGL
jgi:SAM-dependent methyltransferase